MSPKVKRRGGAAAVELALVLPLVCSLVIMGIDYARIFYFTMTATNCARVGALYACQNPTTANDKTGIATAATKDAGSLDPAQLSVTSSTDSASNPTYVIVTVSYPFSTLTNFPSVTAKTTITRSVRITVTPLIPG